MTNVRGFLSNITEHLNNNVQKLTVQYSPVNIQSYILSYLPTFLTNLAINTGSEAQILEMNLLYFSKILSPNASACMSDYDSKHLQIYSSTATNFTKLLTTETSTTGAQLDTMRGEIRAMVVSLVGTLETIIGNRSTARQLFDGFVSSNFPRSLTSTFTACFPDCLERQDDNWSDWQLDYAVRWRDGANPERYQKWIYSNWRQPADSN